jgi:UDP-N-acetylglucosamine 2-epimerase
VIRAFFVFGTRPEAIKIAPVIRYLRQYPDVFDLRVCVTAQHREMLDQVLSVFDIQPDYDLNAMRQGQTLPQSTSRIIAELEPVMNDAAPDMVLVQGDTTTTMCGALVAFYAGVPVAHIEAGLRTGDMGQPFPEEMNRVVVSRLSTLHFAATRGAANNLRTEGVREQAISVTGNSGIDAVLQIKELLQTGAIKGRKWPEIDPDRKLIVVTAHRRESFGAGFERICTALTCIANRADVQVIYPVHPNPNVSEFVNQRVGSHPRIHLIEPVDYVTFVDLMRRAYLVLTDSGGIQEEGPSLGKPILVMREKTERPEAVEAGTVELVGSDVERIVSATTKLLDDNLEYNRRSHIHNPYGDGHASELMANALTRFFVSSPRHPLR